MAAINRDTEKAADRKRMTLHRAEILESALDEERTGNTNRIGEQRRRENQLHFD